MNIRVLSLTAAGSDGVSVCFEIDGGERRERKNFVISTDALIRLGIQKGESSPDICDQAEREARIYSAYNRGLNILGYGRCSKRMLVAKLIAKGEDRSASLEAVECIEERGFIDEAAGAEREAEIAVGKLWGERRIRAYLAERKYPSEIIDQAIFTLEDNGLDFDVLCRKAVEKRYKRIPTDRVEMQKLIASICRLGYSVSQVRSACIVLQEEYKRNSIFE